MGFGEAITSVLTKNYANFSGRARRSEFWFWTLFTVIVGIVLGIIRAAAPAAGLVLEVLWFLGTVVPGIAVTVRRFHDTGRSGWFYLLIFPGAILLLIPLIVAIVFLAQDSAPDNEHGPSPKGGGVGGYPGADAPYPPQYGQPSPGGAYPPPSGS